MFEKSRRKEGEKELGRVKAVYIDEWKNRKVMLKSGKRGKVVGFVSIGYFGGVGDVKVKIGKDIFIVNQRDIVGKTVKKYKATTKKKLKKVL